MTPAPTLTADDLDVAVRLRTAVTRLNRRLRQQALGKVSPAQASMLAMADRLGSPTLGELARAEQIQPPTMTRLVGTMVDAGFLSRFEDPADRRISRVSVTAAGRKELERIRKLKTAYLVEQIDGLDREDRERAAELVGLLERLAEGG
jgi:DNA-binding MarR family transcriptional regulator